jgi:hypothetical protein
MLNTYAPHPDRLRRSTLSPLRGARGQSRPCNPDPSPRNAGRGKLRARSDRDRVRGIVVSCLLALASCTTDTPADHPVTLHLANTGAEPLHCRLMFGHWVDRDLGRLAAGQRVDIAMLQQDADGALFILRDDGQRRMMIETIHCGREGDWMNSYGQVDLAPARSARPAHIDANCAAPAGPGRVACTPIELEP